MHQSHIPRGVPKTATDQPQTGSDDTKDIRDADRQVEISSSRLSVFQVLENVDAQHFDDFSIQFLWCFVDLRSQNYHFELQNGALDLQNEAPGLQKEPLGVDLGAFFIDFWIIFGRLLGSILA